MMSDIRFTDVRVNQSVSVTQVRVDQDRQFDLIVAKDRFKAAGEGIATTERWLSICNDNLMVGPTVADIELVVKAIRDVQPARVAAFGGARVLGATVLGSYLARQLARDDVGPWLVGTTSNGERNFCSAGLHRAADRVQVHVIPASILAVQAAIAKTWIVNEPNQSTTYWGSAEELVPNRTHIVTEYLTEALRIRRDAFERGLAVVISVFVETIAYAYDDPQGKRSEARSQLDSVAAAIPENRGEELTEGFVRTCVKAAIESRSFENDLGPVMPALALSQAVARTCTRVPGSQVVAHILPHMLSQMEKRRRLFAERRDVTSWTALCRRLQGTWPEELRDDKYEDLIAERASMQTLSRRAGLTRADHKAVLSAARQAFRTCLDAEAGGSERG